MDGKMNVGNWTEIIMEILREEKIYDEIEKVIYATSLSINADKLYKDALEKGEISRSTSLADYVKNMKQNNNNKYREIIKKAKNKVLGMYDYRQHNFLVEETRKKIQSEGYTEIYIIDKKEERNQAIEKLRKLSQGWLIGICQGEDTRPDLIAFKGEEFLIIEVASYKVRLAKQLYHFQMAGRTLLILPIPTEKLQVWGTSQLFSMNK